MPVRLHRLAPQRGYASLRRAEAGCGPARHLSRARSARRCPGLSHRVVGSREEAGATKFPIRPCLSLSAGLAQFAVQLSQQLGQRILPLGTGEGGSHVSGHAVSTTSRDSAPSGSNQIVGERHRNFHTESIPSCILTTYRAANLLVLQPLRRRVEYWRDGAAGPDRGATPDLPPLVAAAPDLPPRRSRRLGTGEAASSACSSGSSCSAIRSPLFHVREGVAPPLVRRPARRCALGRRRPGSTSADHATTLARTCPQCIHVSRRVAGHLLHQASRDVCLAM